jgi:hypothetical protein
MKESIENNKKQWSYIHDLLRNVRRERETRRVPVLWLVRSDMTGAVADPV